MISALKDNTVYLLPDGQRAMCKKGGEHTFLMRQGKTGNYDILAYMVAYDWLYHIVKILGPKYFEWQPSDWMATDLVEASDGKTH